MSVPGQVTRLRRQGSSPFLNLKAVDRVFLLAAAKISPERVKPDQPTNLRSRSKPATEIVDLLLCSGHRDQRYLVSLFLQNKLSGLLQ